MSARQAASLVILCTSISAGCTSIPQAAAMRPDFVPTRTSSASAQLHVSGGQDFKFRISDDGFEKALRASLAESGVFQIVERGGDYRLDVVVGDDAGIEGREIAVLWSLSRGDTGETVWQDLVASEGKSFQFVGVVRLRRSVEMAARENIRMGIELLSNLDLDELPTAPQTLGRENAAPRASPR